MPAYHPGDRLEVQTAQGEWVARRAASDVTEGRDFPVVWVCLEQEWVTARQENRQPAAVPWPAEAVRLARSVPA